MRKVRNSILAILFTLGMIASNFMPIFAQEWNDKIYRFNDTQDVISEEDFKAENDELFAAIPSIQFDIATFIVDEDHYSEVGFRDYLDIIYEQNEMGYGVNHDGIVLGMDVDNEKFLVEAFGRGQEIFQKDELDALGNVIQIGYTRGGYIDAQRAYRENVVSVVSASGIALDDNEVEYASSYKMNEMRLYNKNYEALPDWYVEDPTTFKDFHNDPSVSRIIDNAGLLNDEDYKELQKVIKTIYKEDHQDIVVYTDTTSHGMDNELYSQDFYVYNGYGYGDSFDGLILFVNMDPDNREMVTSACGSSRDLFTQSFLNTLDDSLYDYFIDKDYSSGIVNWIHGVQNITHYGQIYVAPWYKDYINGTTPKNASSIKLVDDLGYFNDEKSKEILDQINELNDKYGYDIVVYVTDKANDLSNQSLDDKERVQLYADTFYKTQGYGKDGILLAIFEDESSICNVQVRRFGAVNDKMSDKVCKRLQSLTLTNLGSGEYEKNINRYLTYLGKFFKSGRLPHTLPVRIFWLILCTLVGAIFGSSKLASAKAKMKTVKKATSAYSEMVPNSLKIHHANNVFTHTTETRVYSPVKSDSGSSGRSGGSRSSYSSHSSSSSGRSFSSSRRKF